MADELNKDVVGARINLDTSKILPAFKVIDEAAKKNTETFKGLNAELAVTAKSYGEMTKAADKLALTSDERRKKILAESAALVAQRTAQAEYYKAKTQQLDVANQVVESKLKAQQAIQKKRQNAIEQQEKEHKQRMATLQQKTAAASGQENLIQARLDREFIETRRSNQRMEQEAERHAVKMDKLLAPGSTMMHGHSENTTLSTAFNRMAPYMLAGNLYFNAIQGAKEAITVLKDFESTLVGVQRVMGANVDVELVKESMIQDAKEYGYALKDVGDVYVQIAQQGFNEKDTAALAKTAMMAANVEESFKGAAQAQQLLTGAILNYNMAATDSERLLDRLNQVSNDYATDSNKLLQGINRVGAAANNAGVDINTLIGYLTVLNEAGFSGSVAGNAVKSFISFSSRDIAIDKLEKYVGTIKQATGEMMPFKEILQRISEVWNKVSDAERHEITQAVARGDQASRFIALMDNYQKVMQVASTAENSFGSAQRENALAMTTLEKQSMQLKAAWDELVVSIGDNGLLAVLKEMVHTGTLLIDGFNSLPEPIRNTLTATLLLGGAILTLNTGMRMLTGQSLIQLVVGLTNGARAMMGLKVATDAANVSQKAFAATPIGAVLTGIALAIGAATAAWSYFKGASNAANEATIQNERDTYALAEKYKELRSIVDDNTKSDKEIKQAKDELAVVITKISSLMPGLISQWDAHGQAIDVNISKLEAFRQEYASSMRIVAMDDLKKSQDRIKELESKKKETQFKQDNFGKSDLSIWDMATGKSVDSYRTKYANDMLNIGNELTIEEQKLKNAQETLDLLDGKKKAESYQYGNKNHGGRQQTEEELNDAAKQRKQDFDDAMSAFRHQVNIEAKGYADAKSQLAKLRAIRSEFSGLNDSDLYGIDEEIYRLSTGKKINAKGLGSTKKTEDPLKKSFDDFRAQLEHLKAIGKLTTEQELAAWKKAQTAYGSQTELRWQTEENIYNLENKLREDRMKKEQDSFTFSENWINHKKAMGELSAKEELAAWERVQKRYLQGTEQRIKADEQVYAAKQKLVQEEENGLDQLISKERSYLQDAKQQALQRIQDERDAYVAAQDEKIKAIDRLLAAEQSTNDDSDYEKKLAEKQARQALLQSAVGPEGKKELRDVTKEIADMQLEHSRVIRRRDLEAQKQELEDEKAEKEKAWEKERQDTESHYDDLLKIFDGFKNDVAGRAELLKNIQIQKEAEKNATILSNLDTFISQYKAKMSAIAANKTQAELDFEKYTENQRIWNDPRSTSDQKKAANKENIDFRNKYGISQTNYSGIQHFADGGVVKGSKGQAVPVVAHGGEMYLNEQQQGNLFRLLNFKMPSLSFSMPQFAMASGSNQSIVNNHYYTVSTGNVNIADEADARTFWNERDNVVRRFQSRTGAKQRS